MLGAPWIAISALAYGVGCGGSVLGSGGDDSGTGGDGGSFGEQLCAKQASGGHSIANCQEGLEAIVLSPSCQQMVLSAPCSAWTGPTLPADLQSCLPPCSSTTNTCNGDRITGCAGGVQFTADCLGVCEAESKMYTGTCASS